MASTTKSAIPAQTGKSGSLQALKEPPKQGGKPYALEPYAAETWYVPTSLSATRMFVTGNLCDNAFAIVGGGGGEGPPIGFHYHREAHDVFLCLKGNFNVWGGDKCRTMSPGDFASVPSGVIHQFQLLGDHTEFIGLIVPGGWEEFFRFIADPYSGPMWPLKDDQDIFKVLIPRLQAAQDKYDYVGCPDVPYFPPQPWKDGADNKLPGKKEAYFLKHNTGPAYLVEGAIVRPLVTTKESEGRFAVASIEASSWHKNLLLKTNMSFESVHHAFHVLDGTYEITVDGSSLELRAHQTVYVPPKTPFHLAPTSRYARVYVFASGAGLIELLRDVGEETKTKMVGEQDNSLDSSKLHAATQGKGIELENPWKTQL